MDDKAGGLFLQKIAVRQKNGYCCRLRRKQIRLRTCPERTGLSYRLHLARCSRPMVRQLVSRPLQRGRLTSMLGAWIAQLAATHMANACSDGAGAPR
jgi:hypothetical protein